MFPPPPLNCVTILLLLLFTGNPLACTHWLAVFTDHTPPTVHFLLNGMALGQWFLLLPLLGELLFRRVFPGNNSPWTTKQTDVLHPLPLSGTRELQVTAKTVAEGRRSTFFLESTLRHDCDQTKYYIPSNAFFFGTPHSLTGLARDDEDEDW